MGLKPYFHLPESFDPREYLKSANLAKLLDDARYFVSLVLSKLARGCVDEMGNVRLKAEYLRKVMHKHHYARVIDRLLEGGAIKRTSYVVGSKSFGYTLGDCFRRDRHVRVSPCSPRLLRRLDEFNETAKERRHARLQPVHLGLESHQRQLRVDPELANQIIDGLPSESNPFDIQRILVSNIERQDYHLSVGEYGRVSNSVTNLKREVRSALRVRGEPLEHVDVACCQPGLVAKMMQQRQEHGIKQEEERAGSIYDAPTAAWQTADLEQYTRLVQSGTLYDFLLGVLRIRPCPNLTRDELKRRFLTDVLAKRKANRWGAEYPSDIEDCFRELFPTVYRWIRSFNSDGWDHANLIRELQRQESRLVIEKVSAHLLALYPELFVLTLHDAIFTTNTGIPLVVQAFESEFEQSGFRMTLKTSK